MCDISRGCTLCSELVWAAAGQVSNLVFILPRLKQSIPLQIYFLGNQAAKWNGTTSVDQWVHAAMPSLNFCDFLSSSSFIHWYQEMTEKSEHNSISLMSCTPFPVFRLSINESGELVSQRKWAMFPMKLFIIYNITKNQVAIVVDFFHKKSLSHHPHFTAERESWQETGKTRMKHMVAPFLQHVWDFYELFWRKTTAFAC